MSLNQQTPHPHNDALLNEDIYLFFIILDKIIYFHANLKIVLNLTEIIELTKVIKARNILLVFYS